MGFIEQCTTWIQNNIPWAAGIHGNAYQWANSAQAQGDTVTHTPTFGSIAVFQPGVAGADRSFGHVGLVTGVGQNSFTMTGANWPEGTVGQSVTVPTSAIGQGISFIQPPGGSSNTITFKNGNTLTSQNGQATGISTGTNPVNAAGSSCKSLSDSMNGAFPVIGQTAAFFSWIGQSCVYIRIAVIAGAGVLLFFGLKFVGAPDPLKIVTTPVKEVAKVGKTGAEVAA